MLTIMLIMMVILVIMNLILLLKLKRNDDKDIKELILNENSRTKTELSTILNSNIQTFSNSISTLTDINLKKLSEINETLQRELKYLIEKNEKKLEEMRLTVDEKLHSTLEKRLSESFKLVSQQLESVYRGIGDMQRLATEVGDLKKILSNVKQRGIMGETQLNNILEDIIPKDYYLPQYKLESGKVVDFVIKIPSKADDNKYLLLPIDAKFPIEDLQKISNARELMNKEALDLALKELSNNIIRRAKEIKEYIIPTKTTDFAIMFLPSESLFAEVLSIPGLFDKVKREFNVIITGPTTITAILSSLNMGFRTLAIEKKSNEVWKILSLVKTEFIKFSDMLEKTKKKLEDATSEIEKAQKATQNINKRLEKVEVLDNESSSNTKLLDT